VLVWLKVCNSWPLVGFGMIYLKSGFGISVRESRDGSAKKDQI